MGSLKIDVLGTSFTINASEDDSYLEKLLGYYKKIIVQIQKSGSLTNNLQISALAGIMLCDELYKEKSKLQQLTQSSSEHVSENKETEKTPSSDFEQAEFDRITSELIKKIDGVL